tara:strand:+ start:1834 stop:2166 length:333 start_codon:yes stop_codon:yes gene_type:complete
MPPANNNSPQPGADTNISTCLLDLSNKIEQLIASHKELAENIAKLKDAIYHPDEGIYSRIRELEREIIKDGDIRIAKVEETVASVKKIQWMIIGSTVAGIVAVIFRAFSG